MAPQQRFIISYISISLTNDENCTKTGNDWNKKTPVFNMTSTLKMFQNHMFLKKTKLMY